MIESQTKCQLLGVSGIEATVCSNYSVVGVKKEGRVIRQNAAPLVFGENNLQSVRLRAEFPTHCVIRDEQS